MNQIAFLTDKMFYTFESILNSIYSINRFIIKSDDENLNELFDDPRDKVKFQKAVDELLKHNEDTKMITINGKSIKISI